MSIRDRLRGAARELRDAGVPDPEYDSAALMAYVTGREPLALRMETEAELTPAQEEAFQRLLIRRTAREPLQYILGTTVFSGLEFEVCPGVLIPRPETELIPLWTEVLLRENASPEILDLCCGSGCLGLAIKYMMPLARVTMSDLSPEAVRVSERNREKLDLNCEILQGDLFEPLQGRKFDCIVSNPPYIPTKTIETLQREVKDFEPRLALDGGADGLDIYRRIAEEAPKHVTRGGMLIMEVGEGEAQDVAKMFQGKCYTMIAKDFNGIERYVKIIF